MKSNRPLHALAVSLFALLFAVGCGRRAEVPAGLEGVAHPDLGAIEEETRRQLEAQRSILETKLAKGAERRELASAFGGMGELYHAYELSGAGAACYRNAERLDPESFLWPYYLGALHQSAGDMEAAASSLERALAKERDDPPALLRLGEVRLALGDAAGAREHFGALLGDGRFAAAGHFGLGRSAAALGDAAEAVEHFEKTLELQPRAGIVHHSLGLALRRLDRPDEARAHLEEKGYGEVRAPDRLMERLEALAVGSGAHLRRGNRALMAGRLDEAARELRLAVEADPRASQARRNLALVLMRLGDADGAIQELEAAARAEPDVWIHVDLGNAYLSKGRGEQAVRSFQRAVELDPALVLAHFNLSNALIGLDRWGEARPHLETVLRLDPDHRRARYLEAMAGHRAGDTEDAIGKLQALLDEDPTDAVARQGLATVLVDAERSPRAMAVYRAGLELDIPAAEKMAFLDRAARLAWQIGRREQAIADWRRATDLEPTSSQAQTNLANALQLSGQRGEARSLFARAVELDPGNATAWLSEASLWILDGELAMARRRLEAALVAAPDHPGLNHTLARLLATSPTAEARDGRRALALARKAYGFERSIDHAETVAMALAELGQFEEAIRFQRRLLSRAAQSGDQNVMRRLATHLRLYENRRPVRVSG